MIEYEQSEPGTFLIKSDLTDEQMERLRGQIEGGIARAELHGMQIVLIQRLSKRLEGGIEGTPTTPSMTPLEPKWARRIAHDWILGNRESLVEVEGRMLKVPTNDANRDQRIDLAKRYLEDPVQRWEHFAPWLE